MTDQRDVSAAGAEVAKQIRTAELRLEEADQRHREAVDAESATLGDVDSSASRRTGRDQRDQEHQKLLDDRSDLVQQLELLDGDS